MSILNCKNINTTYESLESLYTIEKNIINHFLNSIDDEELHQDSYPEYYLVNRFHSLYDIKPNYNSTIGFHAARCFGKDDYGNGLLPLDKVINTLWDSLFNLISNNIKLSKWKEFRNTFEKDKYSHTYSHRMDTEDYGPVGFIIKEHICYQIEYNNLHFITEGNEIIIDICDSFDKIYKTNLRSIYQEVTFPCIVQFQCNKTNDLYIGSALYYLYLKSKHQSIGDCNYTIDCEGEQINPKNVLDIEIINNIY